MAAKKAAKKSAKKSATRKKSSRAKAAVAEPVDPRAPLAPTAKNLTATLDALRAVLADIPPPEEPSQGDLVDAFLHLVLSDGLPCGYGQEALRRIDESSVDRNEFRVTEAYEIEELLVGLDLPDMFERCRVVHESIAQIYNDQNGVSLDSLREASVSDRKNFFQRVPAIPPRVVHALNHLLAFDELAFSTRSTQRVQTRLGLEPKDSAVAKFVDELRSLLAPYGHLPLVVGPHGSNGAPNTKHELSPACLLVRLGPEFKGKRS